MATKKFQFNLSSLNGKKQQDAQNKKLAELGRTANSFNNNSMVKTNATNPNKPETMNNKTIKSTDEDGKEIVRSFSNNKVIPQIKPINLPSGTIRDDVTVKPPQNTIKPIIKPMPKKEQMLEPKIATKPLLNTSAAQSAMSRTSQAANRPIGTPTAAPIAKSVLGAGFQFGAASAFGGTKMGDGAIGRNLAAKQAENEDVFNKAKIGGQFAGTAAQYLVANQAVKAIPKLAGLSASKQILPTIGIDQLVDNVVQTPRVIAQGRDQGKSGAEIGMDVLKQNATDLAINTSMALGGRAIGLVADILKKRGKPIAEALTDTGIVKEIEEVTGTKQGTPEFNQLIDEYKSFGVTPDESIDVAKQAAKDIQAEQYLKQFEPEVAKTVETPKIETQKEITQNIVKGNTEEVRKYDPYDRYDFVNEITKENSQVKKIIEKRLKNSKEELEVVKEFAETKTNKKLSTFENFKSEVKKESGYDGSPNTYKFNGIIVEAHTLEDAYKDYLTTEIYLTAKGTDSFSTNEAIKAVDDEIESFTMTSTPTVTPNKKPSKTQKATIEPSVDKTNKTAQTATDSVKTASVKVDDTAFEIRLDTPKPKPSLKRGSKQTKAEILSDYKSKQKAQEATKDWKAVEKQSDKIQKEVDRVESINNRKQGEGSVEGFREGINYDKKKKRRTISEVMEGLRRDFVDDLAPLEKAEKAIYGKVQSAENSLYKTARNEKRSTNLAEQIIHADLEPIIKGVEKSGKSYRDLGEYALAVHARDVNSKGIISGFDNADIAKTIDEFGTPEMESARKELVKISNKLLEMMEESGLLSKGQVKAMLEKHPNYMPLFRHFDDEKVDFVSAFGESFSKSDAPIFALKGSERQANDPIENMLKNIYRSVDAARKNDVGTQLIKLAEADTNGLFARVIKETESTKRKNVVSAVVDGKQVQIEVEPELYKAFTGMNKEMSNKIVEILSKPASVLRAGATLSPEFAARNPMRDMVEAFTKSESGFNPITDFPRGLASVIKKDEYYDLWMRSGGGGTGIISHDIQAHRKGLLEGLKKTPREKIITVVNPNTYLDILRGMSEITEEATRLGEFKKALKGGASPQEAAYRSADLMDFTRSGASVRQVNRVVAFFNANIQGKSKLIRAIKENPKQASVKAVTSMALPTVAIFGYNQNFASKKQRQTIDDAPDWQKNTFWLIASPFDDEYVIRIPKPFELSIVANATERFMEFTVQKDPKAFDDFFGQTIKDQGMPIMPTGLIPIIEGATNYSMFRQAAIVPERERYVKRENQYDYTTSEVAKGVAKGVRAVAGEDSNFSSPRVVDYMLKSSTGGLGTYALDATDALLDALGLVDRPTKAKKDVTQMPLIKGFTVNSLSSGKSVGQLYDIDTAFEKEKKTMRDEIGDNYDNNKEYKKLKEDANKVSEVTDQLSDISKEIRTINNDKKMSAESKQKKLKELNDKRNKIAYEFAKELEKAKWFKERGID